MRSTLHRLQVTSIPLWLDYDRLNKTWAKYEESRGYDSDNFDDVVELQMSYAAKDLGWQPTGYNGVQSPGYHPRLDKRQALPKGSGLPVLIMVNKSAGG